MISLPVLYQDDHLVVIHKPSGAFVHRSALDPHVTEVVLQTLRDQLGYWVYPVHRLDRPTSGVMVFALSSGIARHLATQFEQRTVDKRYLAVVRGFGPVYSRIERPLKEEDGRRPKADLPALEAVTTVRRLAEVEWPVKIERFNTTRYSLMQACPHTGRRHQIRRHLSHAGYPIIGDAKHGKGVHNRYFKDHLGAGRLLLAATHLAFDHPVRPVRLSIQAPVAEDMAALMTRFGWSSHTGRHDVRECSPSFEPLSFQD
ncbi:pseudouridine synthase [Larsenimonas rhizosphaerae]|uniref:pseudouridine synthase n=1 Tax=Larsenimonas rhizosphaerae TaxID=2944682 RepID=UPI0020346229|nr:pseudouridine synthase [Larsenimonas rhizosphaerae]MCM2129871.1 pseudouridine synthase [Larsenimonas rhizosphaerae]